MKHELKNKPKTKNYPMSRAAQQEKKIMENPVEQNSKNSSGIPESTKARKAKETTRLEVEVEKMEEDMTE